MQVLGIESTCDETAAAVVVDGRKILSNVVSTQTDLHDVYGGVVPELACRRHIDMMIPVIDKAIHQAKITLSDIDLISVSYAPGLIGAILIGLNAAKALSVAIDVPFLGINHIEAHLYAALMSTDIDVEFPCLGVVLSGGHTALVLMKNIGEYELIGKTCDDAIGEAFDKVAKIMGLPYPGGPIIEKLAKEGNPNAYPLKSGTIKNRPYHFSFSGLKTAVIYSLKGQNANSQTPANMTLSEKANMAASFQQVAFRDVINKTLKAANEWGCKNILFGGGVTSSETLRELFSEKNTNFNLIWPSKTLCLDNAAMIAGLGYHKWKNKKNGDSLDLDASSKTAFSVNAK